MDITIQNKLLESSTLNWEEVKDLYINVLKFLGTALRHRRYLRDENAGKERQMVTNFHQHDYTSEVILELMRNDQRD